MAVIDAACFAPACNALDLAVLLALLTFDSEPLRRLGTLSLLKRHERRLWT